MRPKTVLTYTTCRAVAFCGFLPVVLMCAASPGEANDALSARASDPERIHVGDQASKLGPDLRSDIINAELGIIRPLSAEIFQINQQQRLNEIERAAAIKKARTSKIKDIVTDSKVAGALGQLMSLLNKARFPPLSRHEDDAPWPGAPSVPADCFPGAGDMASDRAKDCRRCFTVAQAELDKVRRRLDYNSRVYRSGVEYLKSLVAMGEAARNTNFFANLATRADAKALAQNVTDIQASYDKALDILLKRLRAALDQIAECEDRAFGNDWYNRYGFMLYQTFALHYKRTD